MRGSQIVRGVLGIGVLCAIGVGVIGNALEGWVNFDTLIEKHFSSRARTVQPPPTRMAAAQVASPAQSTLAILSPAAGATVSWRAPVDGRTDGRPREIWLIVRPIITNDCWVQPRAAINDGRWRVTATFGNVDSIGAEYELRAIANPTAPLREGPVACWPQGEAQSDIVSGLIRR